MLVSISTSGNSANRIGTIEAVKLQGIVTVLLLGKDGGKLRGRADHEIIVPHFGFGTELR